MKYPNDMDEECIPLCDALNALPGIKTHESCCGHGKDAHRVFFMADTIEHLLPILLRTTSSGWHVEVHSAISTSDMSDVVSFMLEGPVGPADIPGGANDLAEWIKQGTP